MKFIYEYQARLDMTKVVLRGSWGCQHCKTNRGPPQNDSLGMVAQGIATAKPIGAHSTLGCPVAMYQVCPVLILWWVVLLCDLYKQHVVIRGNTKNTSHEYIYIYMWCFCVFVWLFVSERKVTSLLSVPIDLGVAISSLYTIYIYIYIALSTSFRQIRDHTYFSAYPFPYGTGFTKKHVLYYAIIGAYRIWNMVQE